MNTSTDILKKEFDYFLNNHDVLVKEFDGKHLIIKDEKVQGAYDSFETAFIKAIEMFELGTFIIQLCTPGDEAYTQSFHSRVVFA